MTQKNVLVTGGAGFIGTHVCRQLVQLGHRTTVLDLRRPENSVDEVEYVQGDVRDTKLLDSLVAKADVVYHLAASVSVPLCQNDPAESYSNNVMATVGVLEAIRHSAAAQKKEPAGIVFASSAALYGDNGNDGRALSEKDTASSFTSFYAAQKHACEKAIELYHSAWNIPAVVFRFFNVFGPGQDPTSPYSGVITVFLNRVRESRPLPLNGGGTQTRDFVSVHDIASACTSVISLPRDRWDAKPINLGTGRAVTIRELAEAIVKSRHSNVSIETAPAREGDVLHSKADITRAREHIGYQPKIGLNEGLAEI